MVTTRNANDWLENESEFSALVTTATDAAGTATMQAGIAQAASADAGAARDLAQRYAQTPEDTTVPGGSGYSALHYAEKSADSAAASAGSAASAAASAATATTAAANAQASALTCATWAELSALTGATAGTGAEVLDSDTGTHTDPVVGGTVSNAGRYTWSASPAGWKRIGGTGLSGVNADLRAIGIVKMSGLSSAARAAAIHEALAAGVCRIYEKGIWSVNAGIIFPANALLEIGPGVILQKVGAAEFMKSSNIGTATRLAGVRIEGQGIIRGLGAVTGSVAGIWGDVALLNCDDGYVRGVTFENTDCGVQHSGNRFDVEFISAPKTAVAFNGPGIQQTAKFITHTTTAGAPVRLDACPDTTKSVTVGNIVLPVVENVYSAATFILATVGTRSSQQGDVVGPKVAGLAGGITSSGIVFMSSGGAGVVSSVNISEIKDVSQANSAPMIYIACQVDGMVLRGITMPSTASTCDLLQVATTGSVTKNLTIRDLSGVKGSSAFNIQGPVDCIVLRGCSVTITQVNADNGLIRVNQTTGSLGRLICDGMDQSGGNALLSKIGGAAVSTEVWLSASKFTGLRRAFIVQSAMSVRAHGVIWENLLLNYIRADGAVVTLRETAQSLTLASGATEIALANGGTVNRVTDYVSGGSSSDGVTLADPAHPAASLQTHLNAARDAGGGVVRFWQPGTFVLEKPLVIDSYVTLNLGPATRLTKPNSMSVNYSMIHNRNIGGTTDKYITVEGGIWDGNQSGNPSGGLVQSDQTSPVTGIQGEIVLVGVSHQTIRNITVEDCNGFTIQTQGDYQIIHNVNFGDGTRRDGLHINGPSHHVDIRNIWGPTYDDLIALNAWDWTISSVAVGDITDVTIEGVYVYPYQSFTSSTVKLLAGTRGGVQANVRRVSIRRVTGYASGGAIVNAVYGYDQNNPSLPAGAGEVSDITVEGLENLHLINSVPLLNIEQPVKNMKLSGVSWDSASVNSSFVKVSATGSVDTLHLNNVWCNNYDLGIDIKGAVGRIIWSNSTLIAKNDGTNPTGSDTGWVHVNATGTLGALIFENSSLKYAGSLLNINPNTTGVVCDVHIVGSTFSEVKHPLIVRAGSVSAYLSASTFKNIRNDLARVEGASLIVKEAACDLTLASGAIPYTLVGTGTVRHVGTSIGVDASKMTKSAPDMVKNVNGAMSCGAGIVITDGSVWKNLFSGATS